MRAWAQDRTSLLVWLVAMLAGTMVAALLVLSRGGSPPEPPAPEPTVSAPAPPVRLGVAVRAERLVRVPELARTYGITSLTPETAMKMEKIHPEQGRYAWAEPDRIVDLAARNRLRVRGHTLVWSRGIPRGSGGCRRPRRPKPSAPTSAR